MMRCGSTCCGFVVFATVSASNSETMRSGPSSLSNSSCAARDLWARRSVRLMISPCAGPSMALCGSSTKSFSFLRMPMVAARLPLGVVHALLHHGPFAIVGDEESMKVELETILDRSTVDLGDQAACTRQCVRHRSRCARRAGGVRRASCANAGRGRRKHECRARPCNGARPRFSAPMTLVVMPDECQSIPITAPKH